MREKREATLESLNKDFYDVIAARRNAHSVSEYGVMFPKEPSQRVRNAVAYNTEVSTLAGIAKYEGFPAVPDIKGASHAEVESDFADIEVSYPRRSISEQHETDLSAQKLRRARQPQGFQSREEYRAPSFSRLGPAGEQFLRETPWANPNHMAHQAPQSQQHVQASHVDGRAENSAISGRGIGTQPSNALQRNAPTAAVDGPLSQQRSPALSNRMSESPELARSAIKKRTALPNPGRESSTAAA